MRRVLAVLITGFLIASGLGLLTSAPAEASTIDAEFKSITVTPANIVVDAPSKHVTLTVVMDEPVNWTLNHASVLVCARTYQDWRSNSCRPDQGFDPYSSTWFHLVKDEKIVQQHTLVFEGDVPSYEPLVAAFIREVPYRVDLTYARPGAPDKPVSQKGSFSMDSASNLTISGPSSIDPASGTPLTLSGVVECYRADGFGPPLPIYGDYFGTLSIAFRPAGSSDWNVVGSVDQSNFRDGTWSYTHPSAPVTGDWRAQYTSGAYCRPNTSSAHHVEAGSGPPPPPIPLPGAPGLSVGEVTQSTVALAWSSVSGATEYRFGWTSASGLPQPTWEQTYPLSQLAGNNPFVMTNLCADCTYTMWIEAVNAAGTGQRVSVTVTTATDGTPPTPPQPPVADVDCSAFTTQAAAQIFFLANDPTHDPFGLDGDRDMLACEQLPCPCSTTTTPGPGPGPGPVPLPPVVTVPDSPVNVHARVKHLPGPREKVVWKWRDPVGGGPIRYWLVKGRDVKVPAGVHSSTWKIREGTVQRFKVRACNNEGCSPWAVGKVRVRAQ